MRRVVIGAVFMLVVLASVAGATGIAPDFSEFPEGYLLASDRNGLFIIDPVSAFRKRVAADAYLGEMVFNPVTRSVFSLMLGSERVIHEVRYVPASRSYEVTTFTVLADAAVGPAVDPSGNLYVLQGRVVLRIAPNASVTTVATLPLGSGGGFLHCSPDGAWLYLSTYARRIERVNLATGTFETYFSGPDYMGALDVAADGSIYTLAGNAAGFYILVIDPGGLSSRSLPVPAGVGPVGYNGIEYDQVRNALYVSSFYGLYEREDSGTTRALVLTNDLYAVTQIRSGRARSASVEGFPPGYLILGSGASNDLWMVDPTSGFYGEFLRDVFWPGPRCLTFDPVSNSVFVVPGGGSDRIMQVKWTTDFQFVVTTFATGLVSPLGLTVNRAGDLFVGEASTATPRIWKIDHATRAATTASEVRADHLYRPHALAFSPDESKLYVAVDSQRRIDVVSMADGSVRHFLNNFGMPQVLDVGPDGSLYYFDWSMPRPHVVVSSGDGLTTRAIERPWMQMALPAESLVYDPNYNCLYLGVGSDLRALDLEGGDRFVWRAWPGNYDATLDLIAAPRPPMDVRGPWTLYR
jgi:DNA-binding beta-propeller fold protein YncE